MGHRLSNASLSDKGRLRRAGRRRELGFQRSSLPAPKAPCSFMVDTWALKGLPYHDFGVCVYTRNLHGASGLDYLDPQRSVEEWPFRLSAILGGFGFFDM